MPEKDALPNKHWVKFFDKLQEIEDPSLKVNKWKDYHVLAYICRRFKEVYQREFAITVKGAPSKSPDMYMVRCIMGSLGTTNMKTIKSFIDWVFDEKIIPSHIKIRKLSFFNSPGLINEFYFTLEEKNKITRATPLPSEYVSMASSLGISINTYGELAFISSALKAHGEAGRESYSKLFMHLKSLGFEEHLLENI